MTTVSPDRYPPVGGPPVSRAAGRPADAHDRRWRRGWNCGRMVRESIKENREPRRAADRPASKHCHRDRVRQCGHRIPAVHRRAWMALLGAGDPGHRGRGLGLDPGGPYTPRRRGAEPASAPAPQLHPDHCRTGRSASTSRCRIRSTTSGPIPIALRYCSNDPNSRLMVSQPACRKLGCTPSTSSSSG